MYAAPPDIPTEMFTRLPDHLRVTKNAAVRFGHVRDSFLEGPSFDRAGNLWCVDIQYGRIFRISPAGEFSVVCQYDGNPNGLKIHADGRIFIADHKQGPDAARPGVRHYHPFAGIRFARAFSRFE